MGQTVYVDLLFMINFSMDFLCFFITAKIMGRKLSTGRAVIASAIGGVYSNVALFIGVGRILSLIADLGVCALICTLVFLKKGTARELPLYVLLYFAVSMALGGFMTAIFNLLNRADLPIDTEVSDGISVWVFALLALASALITLAGGKLLRRKSGQTRADLRFTYNGRSITLSAMTDTGNLLRDPISAKPCIVADISALESILPGKIIRAARQGSVGGIEGLSAEDAKKVRIIPINTASGEGALIALRMERITIEGKSGGAEIDALVALSQINRTADGCKALLPPELL